MMATKKPAKLSKGDRVVLRALPAEPKAASKAGPLTTTEQMVVDRHRHVTEIMSPRLGTQATMASGFEACGPTGGHRLCQISFDDGAMFWVSRPMIKRAVLQ